MSDAAATTMSEHRLQITRVLDAPRDLVWRCWTEAEHFAAWWGPEHFHTPLETVELDPRPGGIFKATMVAPDGTEHPALGTFEEVVAKDRLVFSEHETDHPMIESHRTIVTLTDLGDDRTELALDVTIVCLDELIPMARSGWNSTFDKLAAVLARG